MLAGQAILTVAGNEAPTESPARKLQDSVKAAFGADDADAPAPSAASSARLQSMLSDLEDIKKRLDTARLARAA